MTVDGDRENAAHDDRPAWQRSNWIHVAIVVGFFGLIIAADWVINGRLTYLGPVVSGVAIGLGVLAIRYARRRHSRRP